MRSFSEFEAKSLESQSWLGIPGQVLDSAYEIWEFLREDGPRALFRATPLRSAKIPAEYPNEALFVTLERATGSQSEEHLNRYLESSFLRDANLVRAFRAGRARVAGDFYVYVVTESAEFSLADLMRERALELEEVRDLTQQLLGGLSYLHAENFVYCALRPESVWKVGKEWKLADFSQLRVNGQRELHPNRLFPSNSEGGFGFVPPEGTDGVITTAWDVWSLGTLLKRAVAKAANANASGLHGNGSGRALAIPQPFDEIIRGALLTDPDQRITLGEIGYRLHKVEWGGAKAVEQISKAPVPIRLDAAHEVSREEPASYPLEAWPLPVETREHDGRAALSRSDTANPSRDQPGYALISRETLLDLRETEVEPEERSRKVLTALLIAIAMAVLCIFGYLFWKSRTAPTAPVPSTSATSQGAVPQAGPEPQSAGPDTSALPSPDVPIMPPASGKKTAMDVLDLLGRWTDSAKTHNMTSQLLCYAPRVDRYFDRRNVASDELKRSKEDEFDTLGPTGRVNVSQIAFKRVTPDWVVVTFSKVVTVPGKKTKVTQEEMVLRQYEGRWRISSENGTTPAKPERSRRRGRGQR